MTDKPLLIVKASAGSGKTFTLVEEFLRIILLDTNERAFASVLALTFTNKAAKEMKERIVEALEVLSKNPDHPKFDAGFIKGKEEAFGIDQNVIRERAKACLNQIIHDYGSLSVLTIDKFSHRIVRVFARDLELESDFGIELDSNELKQEVIAEMVDSFGREDDFTKLLYEYSKSNIEDGAVWDVSKSILDFSKTIDNEKFEHEVEKLKGISDESFESKLKDLKTEIAKIDNAYERFINEFLDYLKSLSSDENDFAGKTGSILAQIKKKSESLLDKKVEKILDKTTMLKHYEANDFSHKQGGAITVIQSASEKIKNYIDMHDKFIEEQYSRFKTLNGIRKKYFNIRLINKIQKTIGELKETKNIKEISDLNKEISKIILSESIPFIYERIGEKYKHFLLDEFQDTSVTQWQNLIPLVENGISENKTSLIVGDSKQSIYRFRNGDVEQFMTLPDLYNPLDSDIIESKRTFFNQQGQAKSLESNYRSKKEIVAFNNMFFGKFSMFLPDKFKSIYQIDFEQKPVKGEGGFVEVVCREDFEKEDKIEKTIQTIQSCLDDGFEFRDICIILRKNKEGVEVAKELEKKGIQVISEESLYVMNDLTVQFLISCLRLVSDSVTYENQSLFAEKFCLFKELPRDSIIPFQKREGRKTIFELRRFFEEFGIQDISKLFVFDSLVELVYKCKSTFDLNYEENPYIELFFEQVYKYEIKKSAYVQGFLDWWSEKGKKESIRIPESTNAVKMMTVHKSKGLQFPVVIIPFCEWGFGDINGKGKKNTLWVTRETGILDTFCIDTSNPDTEPDLELKEILKEEKNLMTLDETNNLYVAFTRPELRLYVYSQLIKTGSGKKRMLKEDIISTPIFKSLGNEEVFQLGSKEKKLSSAKVDGFEVSLSKVDEEFHSTSFSFKPIFPNDTIQIQIDFGLKLHEVISKITSNSDVDQIEEFVAQNKLEQETKDKLVSELKDLFSQKEIFNLLFEENLEVLSEKDIILDSGKIIRPDRILLKEGRIIVVDFKTGEPRSKDKAQLNKYREVLKTLFKQEIEGALIYTKSKSIMYI